MTEETGRGFSRLRIRSVSAKALYVIFGALVVLCFGVSGLAVLSGALVAWVLIGVRLFRDDGEAVAPPRFWWRFTGRPRAGYVIGAAFLAQSVVTVLAAVVTDAGQPLLIAAAVGAVAGFAYLHSSLRLHS